MKTYISLLFCLSFHLGFSQQNISAFQNKTWFCVKSIDALGVVHAPEALRMECLFSYNFQERNKKLIKSPQGTLEGKEVGIWKYSGDKLTIIFQGGQRSEEYKVKLLSDPNFLILERQNSAIRYYMVSGNDTSGL